VIALCVGPLVVQYGNYRWRAKLDTQRADLDRRSEYTSARWLDANMKGDRVYVTGSTSFWLNAFSGTPQLIGCCDQGQSMAVLNEVPYKVNSAVGSIYTAAGINWLRALGVRAFVVNGPTSTDEYKDVRQPERFEGLMPLLHRENGDAVYEVLPRGSSLAHVVGASDLVPVRAAARFDYTDILRYAQATTDGARPPAAFEWTGDSRARVRATLRAADLVSVQVAWFPGWKARVGGKAIPVSADGMGFMVLQPGCEGECEVDLAWSGRGDHLITAGVSLAALGLLAVMAFRRRSAAG
jgi:hypothetical protein